MKKMIALVLTVVMLLSLAACGDGGETPTTNEPKGSTPPPATEPKETTAPTEAEPVGELTETARWSLRYDPEIWVWEDEDALDDGDYRSRLTMIIPDPEDEEEELVWFRINAMEVDHENFRSNLRREGFDQYEYAVNNAYETVAVGGLDFLLDDSNENYHLYFTRIVSAGVDVEIEISGDTSHQAVADVLATLDFTIEEGDNVDPPWYWEGTPYAVEPGSVVVGTYTLNST
jgi:predicted small lipoprotein YifL